jgi:hypothetical protein
VSPLRRIGCFLFLAIWLAATQHCGLEGAGIELFGHGDHPSESLPAECADDACPAIEGESYTKDGSSLRLLPPPAALASFFVLLVVPPRTSEATRAVRDRATPEIEAIHRTWRFERRSALPARAPDFVA